MHEGNHRIYVTDISTFSVMMCVECLKNEGSTEACIMTPNTLLVYLLTGSKTIRSIVYYTYIGTFLLQMSRDDGHSPTCTLSVYTHALLSLK